MQNTKARCKQAAQQCVDDMSPQPGRGCPSKPPMLLLRPAAAASARIGLPAPLEACSRSSQSPAAKSAWMAENSLCRLPILKVPHHASFAVLAVWILHVVTVQQGSGTDRGRCAGAVHGRR